MNWLKHLLGKDTTPGWVHSPTTLQLDITNRCNLYPPGCIYCNSQGCYNSEHRYGDMSLEIAKMALFELRNKLTDVLLFLDGEPLLCEDLPKFVNLVKSFTYARIQVYTNGTLPSRRELLRNRGIDRVTFTISAATPETYRKVHGRNLFKEADETVWWLDANKYFNQEIMMRFVQCKENMDELDSWTKKYGKFKLDIAPVHVGIGRKQSLDAILGMDIEEAYRRSTEPTKGNKTTPCMVWPCLAIRWDGLVKYCACSGPEYNLGKVGEISLIEAWKKRNLGRMKNDLCIGCQTRRDDYAQIFNKYLGVER